MQHILLTFVILISFFTCAYSQGGNEIATADQFSFEQRLATGLKGDNFANPGVAAFGDTAVVGSNAGIHVYRRSQGVWTQEALLNPDDPLAKCAPYRILAMTDGRIFAGCQNAEVSGKAAQGAVYVFGRSGAAWVQTQVITASDGKAGDQFGTIDVDGSRLAVGAEWRDSQFVDSGAIYIFDLVNGSFVQQAILETTETTRTVRFGTRMSLDGDTIAGIRPRYPVSGVFQQPHVTVFTKTAQGWQQQFDASICEPSYTGACDFSSVDVRGDVMAVGNSNLDLTSAGGVYLFARNGTAWSQTTRLRAPDPTPDGLFGSAIKITATSMIISAQGDFPGETSGGNNPPGKIYVFSPDGTTLQQTLTVPGPPPTTSNHFGRTFWLDGGTLIVSSPTDTTGTSPFGGAAYVFSLPQLAPLAVLSGRVIAPDGRGLRNVAVSLINAAGNIVTVRTSSLGFFTLENVPTGQSYDLRATSKQYRFDSKTISVTANITDLSFLGVE